MSKELSFVTLDVEDPAATPELLSTSEEDGYSSFGIASSSPEIVLSFSHERKCVTLTMNSPEYGGSSPIMRSTTKLSMVVEKVSSRRMPSALWNDSMASSRSPRNA